MSKERVVAFTDAVLAIIMTILVLDLDKPDPLTWSGFGKLWPQFLAYAFSFFWLGSMWVHLHIEWSGVKLVDQPVLWTSITLLFFCSLIPYSTSLVAGNVLSWDLAIKIVGIMITLTIWPPAMLVFTLAAAMFLFLKSASAERRMQVKIKKDALANNGMATPDDVAAVGGSAEASRKGSRRRRQAMNTALITASIFAMLAGLLHVYIFVMESFLWTSRSTRETFSMGADEAEQTKEMAFNQGFYNLFLAIMSIGGAIVLWCGVTVVGVTLMTAGSASMFCAALVLLCTAPDKHSAAIKQIFFPALTLIALLVALILFA